MMLPDIILLADYRLSKDKPREEREAVLNDAEQENMTFALRQQLVKQCMADGVAR